MQLCSADFDWWMAIFNDKLIVSLKVLHPFVAYNQSISDTLFVFNFDDHPSFTFCSVSVDVNHHRPILFQQTFSSCNIVKIERESKMLYLGRKKTHLQRQ